MAAPILLCDTTGMSNDRWLECRMHGLKDLVPLLSISQNTAYALVRSGQIRSIRIGRTYRIPKEAVLEYLHKT